MNTDQSAQIPSWVHKVYSLEGHLKMGFFLCFFLAQQYLLNLSILICILALFRINKMPQMNKVYWRKVITNEFFHNLLLLIHLVFIDYDDGSDCFTFWCRIGRIYLLELQIRVSKIFLSYRSSKAKQKCHYLPKKLVMILGALIVFAFMGRSSMMNIFIYCHFLRIKYFINQNTQEVFRHINIKFEQYLPSFPGPLQFLLKNIQRVISYMGQTK